MEHDNPEGHSITELELRRAEALPNTRCLLFLLDEEAPWPSKFNDAWTGEGDKGERIRLLRKDLSCEKLGSFYTGTYELASKVQAAVSQSLALKATPVDQLMEKTAGITWNVAEKGSPYPGLMHFTRRFAPVFFGREVEARELLDRLTMPEGRFLIVSGDSGSGKSSLVEAGVLFRLEKRNPTGNRSLRSVRMVPSAGEDPFDALLRALHPFTQRAGLDDYRLGRDLAAGRTESDDVLRKIFTRGLDADELLLFLDQMEELFTVPDLQQDLVSRFLSGLYNAVQKLPLQVVATIRSDLLHHCYAHEDLLSVLNGSGHYALGRAAPHNLYEMIGRPAMCAGVSVPEALARKLIELVGAEPGNLSLLAFVLQRLFEQRKEGAISEAAYEAMGGLTGAVAEHVGEVEKELARNLALSRERLEPLLTDLFEALVQVDVEGLPIPRRVRQADLPQTLAPVLEALIKARLLVSEGEGAESTLSVAHERLFQAWPALSHWVAEHQDDLRLLHQGELDATEWYRQNHDLAYLWHTDRLKRLQSVIKSLPEDRVSKQLRTFAWPQVRLIRFLDDPELDHETRDSIGRHLSTLGDSRPGVGVLEEGTPDIDWMAIPGGKIWLTVRAGKARVAPFHMSRYLVTNAQFQAFADALDGYTKPDWWNNMPPDANDGPEKPRWSEPNCPQETVSWYEAIAFCRWLSRRLGFEVRLPTEYEWQQAATGGDPNNVYPWGHVWDASRCNTVESGLNRTTAVGLYPTGASTQDVLDLSGMVWEWCLNKFDETRESRVLRGGSWGGNQDLARAAHRDGGLPDDRDYDVGFRVVCASPSR